MHLVDGGGEPRRLELVLVDARVGQAFLEGFEHQLLGAAVPAFAEFRATHAENGDLVLDTPSHAGLLVVEGGTLSLLPLEGDADQTGAAFQK